MTSGFACERLYPVGQSAPRALWEPPALSSTSLRSEGRRRRPSRWRVSGNTRRYSSSIPLLCPPLPLNSPLAATIARRRILYARNASSVFEIHSAVRATAAAFILHTGPLFICHGRSSFVSHNMRNFHACTRNLVDCVAQIKYERGISLWRPSFLPSFTQNYSSHDFFSF